MKTTYLEQTGIHATLTTWLYCAFWQLYAAQMSGRNGYIHWPKVEGRSLRPYQDAEQFAKQPNMYDWWFQQPWRTGAPADETWTWEQNPPEMSQYPLMAMPLDTIKRWYREHLFFTEAVEARGWALLDKYRIDPRNTIGVTWRGTDNVTDGRPRLPIEIYFPFLDSILEDNPNLRICATAEEQTILDPLLKRYPNAFVVEEFISSPFGHGQNPERFSQVSGFERGMQPALMVWLFSKMAWYIKNRSSTGAVASWLSTGKIICLAHPENLGYEPASPVIHPKTGEQLWP